MSAFDEANGSKFENLENKMVPVVAAHMILEAVNSVVTDKYLRKKS